MYIWAYYQLEVGFMFTELALLIISIAVVVLAIGIVRQLNLLNKIVNNHINKTHQSKIDSSYCIDDAFLLSEKLIEMLLQQSENSSNTPIRKKTIRRPSRLPHKRSNK